MSNPERMAKGEMSSPCVRNCCLDEQDVCLGCFRSIQEICGWSKMDQFQRKSVIETAQQRKFKLSPKI
jgi:predicted Fe-S protein YdhL (DUF1289 family)